MLIIKPENVSHIVQQIQLHFCTPTLISMSPNIVSISVLISITLIMLQAMDFVYLPVLEFIYSKIILRKPVLVSVLLPIKLLVTPLEINVSMFAR